MLKDIIFIDNYDSFVYNLIDNITTLGARVSVYRNDVPVARVREEVSRLKDEGRTPLLFLSPGPSHPLEAHNLMAFIETLMGEVPMLGVCLGHQAIGEVFGARLVNMKSVCHGMQTECRKLVDDCIFDGLSERFYVGRYHSWVIDRNGFPDSLEVTAVADDGQIMAVRHREYDMRGIQFHPESVLTPQGKTIVGNWLGMCVP